MRAYRCLSRFFCTPLERYIPANAIVARYENAIRLVINFEPAGLPFDEVISLGQEYEKPEDVQWFYALEPPPGGTVTSHFVYVESKPEDAYGNVGAGGGSGTQGPQGPVGAVTVIPLGNVSGDVATNAASGAIFTATLTGGITLKNPTGAVNGQAIIWYLTQGGAGTNVVTLDTKFVIPTSATIPLSWSTGVSAMDMLSVRYDSSADKFYVVSFVPGY